MLKILKSDKDTYITNKVIKGKRQLNANVGLAGTLDLFKLYGASLSGSFKNTELSRILIHFDLDPLRSLISSGKIDINDPSFWCKLHLKDVYGSQPTPTNFQVSVFPLSASFDEGIGRNVTYYSDYDVSNWLTSSLGSTWFVSGCGLAVDSLTSGDYITSSVSIADTEVAKTLVMGAEDLIVDVTSIVSATLSGELPDSGFRISFKKDIEDNNRTYFVKRFGSRNAYDVSKQPRLIVGFDDSIEDDTQNLTFDTPCSLTLYNYSAGNLSNIVSGSSLTQVTGDNCVILKLTTSYSGSTYTVTSSGSQFKYGSLPVSGTYQATFTLLSTDPIFSTKISQSGSVDFTPVWSSIDGTVAYATGSKVTAHLPVRTGKKSSKKYVVSVTDLRDSYPKDAPVTVRLNIFDQTNPMIKVSRIPVESPSTVVKNAYYQVREVGTNEVFIPFDESKNSTKVSSDSSGMFFEFDTSNLLVGRAYVIDVLLASDGRKDVYSNASPVFRIENVTTTE